MGLHLRPPEGQADYPSAVVLSRVSIKPIVVAVSRRPRSTGARRGSARPPSRRPDAATARRLRRLATGQPALLDLTIGGVSAAKDIVDADHPAVLVARDEAFASDGTRRAWPSSVWERNDASDIKPPGPVSTWAPSCTDVVASREAYARGPQELRDGGARSGPKISSGARSAYQV